MRPSRAPGSCALTLSAVLVRLQHTVQVVICVKLNLVSLFFMFFEEIGFKQGHTKEMRPSHAPGSCALTLRAVLMRASNTRSLWSFV